MGLISSASWYRERRKTGDDEIDIGQQWGTYISGTQQKYKVNLERLKSLQNSEHLSGVTSKIESWWWGTEPVTSGSIQMRICPCQTNQPLLLKQRNTIFFKIHVLLTYMAPTLPSPHSIHRFSHNTQQFQKPKLVMVFYISSPPTCFSLQEQGSNPFFPPHWSQFWSGLFLNLSKLLQRFCSFALRVSM